QMQNSTSTNIDALISTNRPKDDKDEDFLSCLPEDCLVDIFTRLDHNDIDEISLLSKRMHGIAEYHRSLVPKFELSHLRFAQINIDEFVLEMEFGKCYRARLKENGSGLFQKYGRDEHRLKYHGCYVATQKPATTESVVKQASFLLRRFNFVKFELFSICIDDVLLNFFEQFIMTHSSHAMLVNGPVFDHNILDVKARFLSILLGAKFPSITMHNIFDTQQMHEQFLKDYSNSVVLPEFFIKCINSSQVPLNRPNKDMMETISLFRVFENNSFLVNTDWLIPAIINRLRLKKSGSWKFQITRSINRGDIESEMEHDLRFDGSIDKWNIRIFKTTMRVEVRSFESRPHHEFDAQFHF
ncbi:hypothetical protein PMAYCL1PPCAC_24707, partial [Pristionchus mayeri]